MYVQIRQNIFGIARLDSAAVTPQTDMASAQDQLRQLKLMIRFVHRAQLSTLFNGMTYQESIFSAHKTGTSLGSSHFACHVTVAGMYYFRSAVLDIRICCFI